MKESIKKDHGLVQKGGVDYQAIIEKINEGVFIHDGSRYIFLNDRVCDICGYSRKELFGMRVLDVVYPGDRDYAGNIFGKRCAREKVPSTYRVRIVRKDGSVRHIEAAVSDMSYKEKRLFLAAVRDITGHTMMEAALDGNEDRLRILTENAHDLIFRISLPDFRYEYVSPSSYAIIGYCPEDFYCGAISEETVIHPDFKEYLNKQKQNLLKGKIPPFFEFKIIHKNGRERWLHEKCVLIRDETGKPVAMEGIARDITNWKSLEEDLRIHRDHLGELVEERTRELNYEIRKRREKEEQYLSLVESVKEWIWETDSSLKITYASPRLTDMLGYTPEEVTGKSPFEFMPGKEGENLKRLAEKTRKHISFEAIALHKDGRPHCIEVDGRPFFDTAGEILGFRGSCNDITEKQDLIDSLKKREQDLASKSESLVEVNAALKALFKDKEQDMQAFKENLVLNLRKMVFPYIHKLQKAIVDPKSKSYIGIIEKNLNQILAPFLNRLVSFNLTSREMEIALLIKEGKTTKAMAEIIGVATSAIDSHRDNIRKKFGLNKKKINLRTYIMSLK